MLAERILSRAKKTTNNDLALLVVMTTGQKILNDNQFFKF